MTANESNGTTGFNPMAHIGLLVTLGVIGAMLLTTMGLYGYYNTVRDTCIDHEQGLIAQYSDNQNELASYTTKIVEMADVAGAKKDALTEIIKGAMEGRYGSKGFGAGSALFVSMKESDLGLGNNLNIYDRIGDAVSAGREAFKNKQSVLIDKGRAYDTYLLHGGLQHLFIGWLGYPSNNLKAIHDGKALTGREALDYIMAPIINDATQKAYEKGKMEAQNPFEKKKDGK